MQKFTLFHVLRSVNFTTATNERSFVADNYGYSFSWRILARFFEIYHKKHLQSKRQHELLHHCDIFALRFRS